MPAISVILPTHNRAHLLGRAIRSVLGQTYPDLELIVVDDASADDTAGCCAGFADRRLRYVRHRERRGAAVARNTGIALSQGRYIAFQDSDDEWLPAKLERQLRVLAVAPARTGVVYCRFRRVAGGHASLVPSPAQTLASALPTAARRLEGQLMAALRRGNFITTQAALVRRVCLELVGGFDEELGRFQDWDLWLRLARRYEFAYLREPLVIVYDTPGSISSDHEALATSFERLFARHGRGRELAAQRLYLLGTWSVRSGRPREGAQRLLEATRLSPLNTAYWGAALLALARAARRGDRL